MVGRCEITNLQAVEKILLLVHFWEKKTHGMWKLLLRQLTQVIAQTAK